MDKENDKEIKTEQQKDDENRAAKHRKWRMITVIETNLMIIAMVDFSL
jgi:hypothetical protein